MGSFLQKNLILLAFNALFFYFIVFFFPVNGFVVNLLLFFVLTITLSVRKIFYPIYSLKNSYFDDDILILLAFGLLLLILPVGFWYYLFSFLILLLLNVHQIGENRFSYIFSELTLVVVFFCLFTVGYYATFYLKQQLLPVIGLAFFFVAYYFLMPMFTSSHIDKLSYRMAVAIGVSQVFLVASFLSVSPFLLALFSTSMLFTLFQVTSVYRGGPYLSLKVNYYLIITAIIMIVVIADLFVI